MKPVFRIRAVDRQSAADKALLEWLQLEILPSDTPADTGVGYWWLLFEGANPAGFCGLHPTEESAGGHLCRGGVLPSYRGHRLQRRLIAVRERKARRMGLSHLVSDTYDNPASSNNLIASGYRMFAPAEPWGAEGTCYWKKKIS